MSKTAVFSGFAKFRQPLGNSQLQFFYIQLRHVDCQFPAIKKMSDSHVENQGFFRAFRISTAFGGQPGTFLEHPEAQFPTPIPAHLFPRKPWPIFIRSGGEVAFLSEKMSVAQHAEHATSSSIYCAGRLTVPLCCATVFGLLMSPVSNTSDDSQDSCPAFCILNFILCPAG